MLFMEDRTGEEWGKPTATAKPTDLYEMCRGGTTLTQDP